MLLLTTDEGRIFDNSKKVSGWVKSAKGPTVGRPTIPTLCTISIIGARLVLKTCDTSTYTTILSTGKSLKVSLIIKAFQAEFVRRDLSNSPEVEDLT